MDIHMYVCMCSNVCDDDVAEWGDDADPVDLIRSSCFSLHGSINDAASQKGATQIRTADRVLWIVVRIRRDGINAGEFT